MTRVQPSAMSRGVTNPGSQKPAPDQWEQAYLRFETPRQEVHKFQRRLARLGATGWPRTSRIVELFCGRGSGLVALHSLGFSHVEGIDLSAALVAEYAGPGAISVGDCRQLPYGDRSRDVMIAQGGLHHLPDLPGDVDRVAGEVERVLVAGGLFVVVEPWDTPFLRIVHTISSTRIVRRLSPKVDALATMIEHERTTYDRWLSIPNVLEPTLTRRFDVVLRRVAWGKFMFVGRKRR